jgi:hypothetical protein
MRGKYVDRRDLGASHPTLKAVGGWPTIYSRQAGPCLFKILNMVVPSLRLRSGQALPAFFVGGWAATNVGGTPTPSRFAGTGQGPTQARFRLERGR